MPLPCAQMVFSKTSSGRQSLGDDTVTKNAQPEQGSGRSPTIKYVLLAAGGLLVDLLLPAVLGMLAWYLLAGSVGLWKLSRALFVVVFFVLFLAVCLLAYGLLRTLVNWRKRILPRVRRGWADDPRKRVVDIAVFGLIVPVAIALTANLVPVSSGDALLVALERRWSAGSEASVATAVADVSLSASSMQTKRQAVETLRSIGSETSLRELIRLVREDPDALLDYGYNTALSSALATFGELAHDELLDLLRERAETPEGDSGSPLPSLYDTFFRFAFRSLRDELATNASLLDSTDDVLLLVDELEVELIRGLDRLAEAGGLVEGGDPTLNLVLDAFLEIGSGESDRAVYRLARALAEDEARATATRSRALRLTAILGTTDDAPFFMSFLQSEDAVLQGTALEAIEFLYRAGRDG